MFHELKLIPLHLIKSNFGINFKFHSNLDFDGWKILTFPSFYNNFSVAGASANLLLLILHLLFYHNQSGTTKLLKQAVNPFMMKNLQNNISFSYMIFLKWKMNLKRERKRMLVTILPKNLISNADKWSVQLPKLGKSIQRNSKW